MTKSSSTPDRILEASLKLFNEHGFQIVTVREISHYLDISAGHVGYYFQSKAEIAMALFPGLEEDMRRDVLEILKPGRPFSAADAAQHSSAIMRSMWRYRFIFSSLSCVLRHHEGLNERFVALQNRIINYSEQVFIQLINQKEMLPALPPNTPKSLAECWWFMWLGWLRVEQLEYCLCETLPGSAIYDGAIKTYGIVQPYFSDSFTQAFLRELSRAAKNPQARAPIAPRRASAGRGAIRRLPAKADRAKASR
jgi:AcrR family transcriptional regulator